MSYFITDECISCFTCAEHCPMQCISLKNGHYVIDSERCVRCGTCYAVCPMEAIVEV